MMKIQTAALSAVIVLCGGGRLARADDPPPVGEQRSTPQETHAALGLLGGLAFPRPLDVEGVIKIGHSAMFGAEFSMLPRTTISGVEPTFWALALDARYFPFKGGFFLGVSGGRQSVSATGTASLGTLGTISESASAETWFVNPRIGYLKTWSSGVTLGFDVGAQIPLAATFATTLPSSLSQTQEVMSIAHLVGKSVLPTVDLLRVGFLM